MKKSIRKHPTSSERANWNKHTSSDARAIWYVAKYQLNCQQDTGVHHMSRWKCDCKETDVHSVIITESSKVTHGISHTQGKKNMFLGEIQNNFH